MVGKDKPSFLASSYHVTAITFLMISIIITTSLLFVFPIVLNQNHTAMAQQQLQQQQQQMQANQTFTPSVEEQRQLMEGLSFQIDNVTFSHHIASVNNGTQIHYVIGGQGPPVVLLHGWPETWYAWHKVMPDLAQNYTVIAPDLRGLGDSSKPPTGYDGKTVAEDIHQLVTQLGFRTIFLVGHDIATWVAYPYAAEHPTEVEKLVIMEVPPPGFFPPRPLPWWLYFQQTPDVPEALVQGKEMEYLSWFYHNLAYNPSAITQEAINEYVSHYSAPGGMRAGFEYYRAFAEDAIQNQNYSQTKLPMPVLALGAGYIPAFGGISNPTAVLGMQQLAENVTGIIVPNSGHFMAEEQPQFVISQLSNFFGRDITTNSIR
jgi:pimeloyl-ACP methyl ester carboxylesterase